MQPFEQHTGVVAPLDRANVDTDAVIPKQYLKSIKRSGFGPTLFDDWRYLDPGEPGMDHSQRRENPDFVLNQTPYRAATILLAQDNFGCGSSREHAVWALEDFGFRAVIAPSFADIFYNNCFSCGVLPVTLTQAEVAQLMQHFQAHPGDSLTIDLPEQVCIDSAGRRYAFEVDPFRKDCLLKGLDRIGLTLQHSDAIRAFEAKRREQAPWLFA